MDFLIFPLPNEPFFYLLSPKQNLVENDQPSWENVRPLRWGIRPWAPRNAEALGSQNSAKALTFRRSRVVRIRSSVWVSEYMRCVSKYLYLVTCDYWILGFLCVHWFQENFDLVSVVCLVKVNFCTDSIDPMRCITIVPNHHFRGRWCFFQPPVFQATLRWGGFLKMGFFRVDISTTDFLWRCGKKQAALKVDSAIGNSPKWWWIGSGNLYPKDGQKYGGLGFNS